MSGNVAKVLRGKIKCRFGCDSPAEGIYHMPEGCICWPDKIQALCRQHIVKAESTGPIYILAKLIPELEWTDGLSVDQLI